MLERWAKTQGEMYVRSTKKKKKSVKGVYCVSAAQQAHDLGHSLQAKTEMKMA